MRLYSLTWSMAIVFHVAAQSDALTTTDAAAATSTGPAFASGEISYASDVSTITITATSGYGSITDISSAMASSNQTATGNSSTTESGTRTTLVGSNSASSLSLSSSSSSPPTSTVNGTAAQNSTATSTSAQPTNTMPCNGHPEFCQRKYSNITQVAAHNSPFVRPGNAASNQMLDVETQLNDGIRMLQLQAHLMNGTLFLCHTSCELLNVGTLENYLTTVAQWLSRNTYDVITVLMGNYDIVAPQNFTAPVINSGLINYVYTPPTVPMSLESWPTLGEMVLTNQRAVVMLDYNANQTAIPWLLDEFSQMWETPFSPTDRAFPCTPQRPPNQAIQVREDRMYMANHNLNVEVSLAGMTIDIPAFTILNETNAVGGYGSAGVAVQNCTTEWNRPPTFLLVDYYNLGNFNGSVFQVAADANGVTYNRDSCCGTAQSSGGSRTRSIKGCLVLPLLSLSVSLLLLY